EPRPPAVLTRGGPPAVSLAPPDEPSEAGCHDRPERLELTLSGRGVLLDEEMAKALETPQPEMQRTWQVFAPSGRTGFEGKVERLPNEKPDIDLTVYPRGCCIRPGFLRNRYALNKLYGKVHYADRQVTLERLSAQHGGSVLSLGNGVIYLKPGGGVWADLHNLQGQPLVPDDDFLRALPLPLYRACSALQLRAPLTLTTRLVIASTGDPGPPVIYWDGAVGLHDASLTAGVTLEHVTGQMASRGRHNGQQLEGVLGNILLTEATV